MPICGFTPATADWLERSHAHGLMERLWGGVLIDAAIGMARRARGADPLELALAVYRELPFEREGVILRYAVALERKNAAIIERDHQRYHLMLEQKRAARGRPAGTRSTRGKGKRKAGRR